MRLTKISIHGFRSVAGLDGLAVGRPTLLTGHNDAGKSAVLDATRYLLGDYQLTDRDPTFVTAGSEVGQDSNRVPETVVIGEFVASAAEQLDLDVPGTLNLRRRSAAEQTAVYEVQVEVPTDERLRVLDSTLLPDLKLLAAEFTVVVASGGRKADYVEALTVFSKTTSHVTEWVKAPPAVIKALPAVERFHPSGTTDADDAIKKALDTAFRAHIAGDEHKGSVRALEDAISERLVEDADEIRGHIMGRCADIGDVQIVPIVSFNEGLRSTQVTVTSREGDGGVGLGEAGAGRARRVALAVWEFTTGFLANAGDTVLIYDEPDTHLDYIHQREFMDVVRSQCDLENVSMLIATHSMNLIDGMDIADVVHVSHDSDRRTAVDVLSDETHVGKHLGSIAAALGLRNTVLLHERLFVGVEGSTETGCFPVLFRLVTGRQLESAGVALWGCRNNEGALDFADFLVAHDRNVVFVVDKDSKENSRHVFSDAKLAMRGLDPTRHAIYIGAPMELEELFSDELWCRLANDGWPRVDGRAWVEDDFAQHRGAKFSSAVVEMAKVASEDGPSSKPDAMISMSLSLRDKSEVPDALAAIFTELETRAN